MPLFIAMCSAAIVILKGRWSHKEMSLTHKYCLWNLCCSIMEGMDFWIASHICPVLYNNINYSADSFIDVQKTLNDKTHLVHLPLFLNGQEKQFWQQKLTHFFQHKLMGEDGITDTCCKIQPNKHWNRYIPSSEVEFDANGKNNLLLSALLSLLIDC